jgi:carboxyl-terminal processing protease
MKLVVVVNRGTAGAAEIAAAALLDSKRADVVGERTYGNAAVRKAIKMDDGGALILSVAKYYSPGGKAIQDTGVTPNVAETAADADASGADFDDDSGADANFPEKPSPDTIMKRAIITVIK